MNTNTPQTTDPRVQPLAEWFRVWFYSQDMVDKVERGREGWLQYIPDAEAALAVIDEMASV